MDTKLSVMSRRLLVMSTESNSRISLSAEGSDTITVHTIDANLRTLNTVYCRLFVVGTARESQGKMSCECDDAGHLHS